jgi:uncharacterized paraquat-inducible protein A
MLKLVEIAKAWITAANPTDEQKEIAEKRISICNECEFSRYNKALDFHYCGECGCPLSKKIFTHIPGPEACPKAKWTV